MMSMDHYGESVGARHCANASGWGAEEAQGWNDVVWRFFRLWWSGVVFSGLSWSPPLWVSSLGFWTGVFDSGDFAHLCYIANGVIQTLLDLGTNTLEYG